MGNRINRVRTEVSIPQMSQAITESWRELFGTVPTKEQISMVLAQNALETAHRKSMWNYNVGNITTNGKGVHDFFDDLTTDEQIQPGVWKKMNLKYRAYPSLKEGVKDYLKFISGKKYAEAWKYILNPNPIAFSKALKSAGYYTANEKPYTQAITRLYNQYTKSHTDKVVIPFPQQFVKDNSLNNILDNYLQMVAASEKNNRKIYKKLLPSNDILIKITSCNYTDAVEFSRILCAALEEELMAYAYTHTDGKNIEIECSIFGPEQDCLKTTEQLTQSIQDTFKFATVKIGGINIKTKCNLNKKSSYKQICFKSSEYHHRKFLLKFI